MAQDAEAVSAHQLASHADDLMVDIRSEHEREGELGYLPGSVPLPEARLEETQRDLLEFAGTRRVVLVCTTGKRASARSTWLAQRAPSRGPRFAYLRGGLLEWGASGYPLVRPTTRQTHDVTLNSLDEFPRIVISCFVAESIETQLNAGSLELANPAQMVDELFGAAVQAGKKDPTHFRFLLDRLADQARRMGHSLDHIAANLETMRAALLPFDTRR